MVNIRNPKELIADIQSVVSRRYVESPEPLRGPTYVEGEDGVPFGQLHPKNRFELLVDAGFWGWYDNEGMTRGEQWTILSNVLEGKPPEKWLDGVADKTAEQEIFRNILRKDLPMSEEVKTKEIDREM